MPVRYTPPRAEDLLPVPGVRLGTAAAKIKRWERDDVLSNYDPTSNSMIKAKPGSIADRALVDPDHKDFAPRLFQQASGATPKRSR